MAIEVIKDEADKRKEYQRYLSRHRGVSRTEISGAEEKYRYKLVNSKARGVKHAKALGFEVVPKDDPAQLAYGEWDEALGAQRLGDDLILMREPMDLYRMKQEENNSQAKHASMAVNETAKENINRMARNEGGAPAHTDVTIDNSEEGDEEQFYTPPRKKS
jgi:hypothetical protein